MFYGALNAIAGTLGPAVSILNKVTQFLGIAKLVHTLLDKGTECSRFIIVAAVISLFAAVSLLVVEATLTISNPIAAFGIGLATDYAAGLVVENLSGCAN